MTTLRRFKQQEVLRANDLSEVGRSVAHETNVLRTQRILSKWFIPLNVLNRTAMFIQMFSEFPFHIHELVTLRTRA